MSKVKKMNTIEFYQPFSPLKYKGNSQVDQNKRYQKLNKDIERKTSFSIGPQHMCFLMEQQRQKQMKIINSNHSLQLFYNTLISLFMISYSSSQIIISNMFDLKQETLGLRGMGFFQIMIDIGESLWNEKKVCKLKIMARNLMKMAPSHSILQRKIQFCCRKITLSMNLREKIETSPLNNLIHRFWQKTIKRFDQKVQLLEEMFKEPAQRLCYWLFSNFCNHYLCDEQFTKQLQNCNRLHKMSDFEADCIPKFSYEFKIIQIFTLYSTLSIDKQSPQSQSCVIY